MQRTQVLLEHRGVDVCRCLGGPAGFGDLERVWFIGCVSNECTWFTCICRGYST